MGQPEAKVSDGNHHIPGWTQGLGGGASNLGHRDLFILSTCPLPGSALAYLRVTQGIGHVLLL